MMSAGYGFSAGSRVPLTVRGVPWEDQVPRLARFRAARPDWVIEFDGHWKARRDGDSTWAVIRYELYDLLNALEERLAPP